MKFTATMAFFSIAATLAWLGLAVLGRGGFVAGFWTVGGEGLRWVGVVLFIAGGALRRPVFVLGKRFSGLVAIQPVHTLVTDGVYRTLRNPSYPGLLINSLGEDIQLLV